MSKSFLIIGNGFDLNCGLNSSFDDFLKTQDVRSNIWYLICHFAFSKSDFEGFVLINHVKNGEILWMDVESLIKRVVLFYGVAQKENIRLLRSIGADTYLGALDKIYLNRDNNEFFYDSSQITLLRNFFRSKFDYNLDIVDFLYNQLIEFENSFRAYIERISENIVYKNKSQRLFRILSNSNQEFCDVLSFNYTIPEFPKNGICAYESLNHVHGSIDEAAIIIGYDSSDVENPKDNKLLLSKVYQKMFFDLRMFNLPNKDDIDCIKIYGHSLGSQDYVYFHSIFEYFDIENNQKISLKFFYTEYGNNWDENEEIKQKFILSVYNLLNRYSSKKNGIDKIDTLSNRLLLENRLKIESVSKLNY